MRILTHCLNKDVPVDSSVYDEGSPVPTGPRLRVYVSRQELLSSLSWAQGWLKGDQL